MTESSGTMERTSCSSASALLEKRIAEEILSEEEQRALEHHLSSCARCRAVVTWVAHLPEAVETLLDAEIDSARIAMLKKRAHLLERQTRNRFIGVGVGIAAAAAALVFVLLLPLSSKNSIVGSDSAKCVPHKPTEPTPGVFLTYCGDRAPDTTVDEKGEVSVSMQLGTVGMRVDPGRRNRPKVRIRTPQGEVRVKGTIFTVHVDGAEALLEVFRGVVEFLPAASEEEPISVTEGHGADLRSRRVFELSRPKTISFRQTLDEAAKGEEIEKQTAATEEAAVDSSAPAQPLEEGSRSRTSAGKPSKRPAPSIDALIREAQSCLIVHDWMGASSRYQDILKYYPGRAESVAVLVSLAKLEARRLGESDKALEHYKRYLQEAPKGPLAEESLFGIADVYRRLGINDKEKKTLQSFIEQYPKSLRLENARDRLEQLKGDAPI